MRRAQLFSAVAAFALAVVPPSSAAELELAITAKQVEVRGLKPGGQAALFSVARVPRPFTGAIVPRHELLEDDDRDGKVALDVEGGVPFRSIWVAADADGSIAMATPDGYPLRRLPDDHPGLGTIAGAAGRADAVLGPGDFYELLLVRTGAESGFWAGTVYDGHPSDDDGPHNGRITASLSGLEGIGIEARAPDRLRPGDKLVGIDANEMTVFLLAVPAGGRP